MLCGYNSEWDALRDASRMRRRGFQCQYLGFVTTGLYPNYYQVKVW